MRCACCSFDSSSIGAAEYSRVYIFASPDRTGPVIAVQVCYGSKQEVARFEKYLYGKSERFSDVAAAL